MVSPAAGSVVLVTFPFSDLSASKLFTANTSLMKSEVGRLSPLALQNVLKSVIVLLNG